MERRLSLLIGAVIAAAFLGPGTVTTAARAGASHGAALLWALAFATVACFVLQEASARLTIVSGRPLAGALRDRFPGSMGVAVLVLVLGAVVLGCAAYEAGNILGGVAGAALATGLPSPVLTWISAILAFALLWSGRTRHVVSVLGALVGLMGVAFLITAWQLRPDPSAVLSGLLRPSLPDGSGLLVLGLIGTTVVPYNLFLGSGLARDQDLDGARWGLAVAIGVGGLVSMAVLVVGTAVPGDFSFESLAASLDGRLGAGAGSLFGWGLFAAGFSSAVTAPLAAALTARGLFAAGEVGDVDEGPWSGRSWRFRAVWGGVLAVGTAFGVAQVKPVPVIILAQALNGLLLPVVAVFLWVVMNDGALLGARRNGVAANLLMGTVVCVVTVLGVRGVLRALDSAFNLPSLAEPGTLAFVSVAVLLGLGAWTWREIRRGG